MQTTTNYSAIFAKRNLLSEGSTNAKLAKNEIKSYILYLAPFNQNSKGINICPNASSGCISACLYTAGRGKFTSVQLSRIQRTEFYINERTSFINKLTNELISLSKKAQRNSEIYAIRLNGTSDLDFIAIIKNRTQIDVLQLPNLIFYDYTKTLGKVKKYAGSPYVLTFSRSEANEAEAVEALQYGANVAVVFKGGLPSSYLNAPVLDGDLSDIVMLNAKGSILGLKAKGDAKKDKSGFVVSI